MSYHIETIPNRNSPPAILLRKAWRDGKRIRKKTIANLSHLPANITDGIRRLLKGGMVVDSPLQAFAVQRSLPHGHVVAVLGLCRQLGLPQLLNRSAGRMRDLALAAVVARVLSPASRLPVARQLSPDSAVSSLGAVLGLGEVKGSEVSDMLDWLLKRQPWIERSLARRYLQQGTLVLYDMTANSPGGGGRSLARFGRNRTCRRGRQQITVGILCNREGCPIALSGFDCNPGNPDTVAAQISELKQRFGVQHIALVGDRGMLTIARIAKTVSPAGLDWISALRTADLRRLLNPLQDGSPAPLQPESLPADRVTEIASPDFPGERLLVCLDPQRAEEHACKREAMLQDTGEILQGIADMVSRKGSELCGCEEINRRLERDINRCKAEKYFDIAVSDGSLAFARNAGRIAAAARLDGIRIVRTSLGKDAIGAGEAMEACKSLPQMERSFRNMESFRHETEPDPDRVLDIDRSRAYAFLHTLASHVEWHLRHRLAPLLVQDVDHAGGRSNGVSPEEPAQAAESEQHQGACKTFAGELPTHSLTTLLEDLGTQALNIVHWPDNPDCCFTVATLASPVQSRAFELLEVEQEKLLPVQQQVQQRN